MKPAIAGSILSFSHPDLRGTVTQMQEGGAAWLHVDVMDGQFVPPITFGDGMVRGLEAMTKLPIEAHLMTLNPERQIEAFAAAGCRRLIFHQEVAPHANRVIQAIHGAGMEAGVAINPGTPLGAISELEQLVESVLVMTVNPGYGGQAFIPAALEKVRELRARHPKLTIEVDGGIHADTIKGAQDAGANLFVVGSYLLDAPSIPVGLARLAEACS